MTERSPFRMPAGAAGEFSFPWSTFRADSYFGIRSTPRVTAVARKRSRPFYQKCKWQHAEKQVCILRMWRCMKWRDTERAETAAAVSRGTSHETTTQRCKYTTWVGIQKRAIRSYSHSFRNTFDKSAVSLLESAMQMRPTAFSNICHSKYSFWSVIPVQQKMFSGG